MAEPEMAVREGGAYVKLLVEDLLDYLRRWSVGDADLGATLQGVALGMVAGFLADAAGMSATEAMGNAACWLLENGGPLPDGAVVRLRQFRAELEQFGLLAVLEGGRA
jgi:hypothetical protein